MAKLKIISNPYKKEIHYQKWQADYDNWVDIDYTNCKNSKLLKKELTSGFFPFCVTKILDAIAEEYSADGESIQIIFDGSDDEFIELEAACKCVKNNFSVQRSNIRLDNARDILPEVKKLFQEMNSLIMQSVSNQEIIEKELNRFTDASSDIVPICVFGNYSTGKSTFINALVGNEILPSGTEPITAKIYKITRSKYQDRALVKCQYKNQNITVIFTNIETKFEYEASNDFLDALKSGLEGMNDVNIALRINKALNIINNFENNLDEVYISDLIEVEMPFSNGVLAQSQHPFVLFDTPGSNSASNAKHLTVLKSAMANMTNGLPIFLSTPDALDSTDNENLYKIIREMKELDNRFTMIVVNKADVPGLQRKEASESEENSILSQSVPRNLYSGGLFYVSSILGLGFKNQGKFINDTSEETYKDQVYKYNNPNEQRYKTLYSYNIMPAQLKQRSFEEASAVKDLVYANSGLFSVETEIENFAGKYSSYNKCVQSQMFLTKVIELTANEIKQEKEKCDGYRQSIKDKLEDDKKKLIEKLEKTSSNEQQEFDNGYSLYMNIYLDNIEKTFSEQELNVQLEQLTKEYMDKLGYDEIQNGINEAINDIGSNLNNRINNASKKMNINAFKTIFSGAVSDVANAKDMYMVKKDIRHQINKAVADNLLKNVSTDFSDQCEKTAKLLNQKSQDYWTEKTKNLKYILAKIVSGSEVLTDERREELEKIIIKYEELKFKDIPTEKIFDKGNFQYNIKFGEHVFWQSDHLKLAKLAKTYNSNFAESVESYYKTIEKSHFESAHTWIQSLLDEIYKNIVKYSPELSKQAEQIKNITNEISMWEQRKNKLDDYKEKLSSMMDWKSI